MLLINFILYRLQRYKNVPISDAIKHNQRIMVSPKAHAKRSAFFGQCAEMTMDELVPKLLKLSFKEKARRKLVGGG